MRETISSTSNKQIKNVMALQRKAKTRKEQGFLVVEGVRAAREVPVSMMKQIFYTDDVIKESAINRWLEDVERQNNQVQIFRCSQDAFQAMSDTKTPQGIIVVSMIPGFNDDLIKGNMHGSQSVKHRAKTVMLLETLQDPGNLGTIFRTAEGAGVDMIIMNRTTVDVYSPKVVRSTMGSIFRVPHIIVDDLSEIVEKLKNDGFDIYAASLKGKKKYTEFDYTNNCGFMIGNEGNGLTDELAGCATDYLIIPMEGKLESLNAAMAAGLLMYEVHRQRS